MDSECWELQVWETEAWDMKLHGRRAGLEPAAQGGKRLTFHCEVSGDRTLVIRVSSKHLYPLSHLASPSLLPWISRSSCLHLPRAGVTGIYLLWGFSTPAPCWDGVSPCDPGWPQAYKGCPALASQVQGSPAQNCYPLLSFAKTSGPQGSLWLPSASQEPRVVPSTRQYSAVVNSRLNSSC